MIGHQDFTTAYELPYDTQGPRRFRVSYAIDSWKDILAVADTANNRILSWRIPLAQTSDARAFDVIGQLNYAGNGENHWDSVNENTLCWSYGICFHQGTLAIADSGNNRVMLWDCRPMIESARAYDAPTEDLVQLLPFSDATIYEHNFTLPLGESTAPLENLFETQRTNMCLAVPGQVESIFEDRGTRMGKVNFGGVVKDVCLAYLPGLQVGDYTIVHVGFAISQIDEASAQRTLKTFEELGLLQEELEELRETGFESSPGANSTTQN